VDEHALPDDDTASVISTSTAATASTGAMRPPLCLLDPVAALSLLLSPVVAGCVGLRERELILLPRGDHAAGMVAPPGGVEPSIVAVEVMSSAVPHRALRSLRSVAAPPVAPPANAAHEVQATGDVAAKERRLAALRQHQLEAPIDAQAVRTLAYRVLPTVRPSPRTAPRTAAVPQSGGWQELGMLDASLSLSAQRLLHQATADASAGILSLTVALLEGRPDLSTRLGQTRTRVTATAGAAPGLPCLRIACLSATGQGEAVFDLSFASDGLPRFTFVSRRQNGHAIDSAGTGMSDNAWYLGRSLRQILVGMSVTATMALQKRLAEASAAVRHTDQDLLQERIRCARHHKLDSRLPCVSAGCLTAPAMDIPFAALADPMHTPLPEGADSVAAAVISGRGLPALLASRVAAPEYGTIGDFYGIEDPAAREVILGMGKLVEKAVARGRNALATTLLASSDRLAMASTQLATQHAAEVLALLSTPAYVATYGLKLADESETETAGGAEYAKTLEGIAAFSRDLSVFTARGDAGGAVDALDKYVSSRYPSANAEQKTAFINTLAETMLRIDLPTASSLAAAANVPLVLATATAEDDRSLEEDLAEDAAYLSSCLRAAWGAHDAARQAKLAAIGASVLAEMVLEAAVVVGDALTANEMLVKSSGASLVMSDPHLLRVERHPSLLWPAEFPVVKITSTEKKTDSIPTHVGMKRERDADSATAVAGTFLPWSDETKAAVGHAVSMLPLSVQAVCLRQGQSKSYPRLFASAFSSSSHPTGSGCLILAAPPASDISFYIDIPATKGSIIIPLSAVAEADLRRRREKQAVDDCTVLARCSSETFSIRTALEPIPADILTRALSRIETGASANASLDVEKACSAWNAAAQQQNAPLRHYRSWVAELSIEAAEALAETDARVLARAALAGMLTAEAKRQKLDGEASHLNAGKGQSFLRSLLMDACACGVATIILLEPIATARRVDEGDVSALKTPAKQSSLWGYVPSLGPLEDIPGQYQTGVIPCVFALRGVLAQNVRQLLSSPVGRSRALSQALACVSLGPVAGVATEAATKVQQVLGVGLSENEAHRGAIPSMLHWLDNSSS
jgi:hypothetical protein